MPTIKTIKPAGGGDYTTIQAWWDGFAKSQATADQWAECYGGGDLGPWVPANFTTATADSTHFVKIYAATTDRHNGTYDSTKADVKSTNGGSPDTCFTINCNAATASYMQIVGLQFSGQGTINHMLRAIVAASNFLVDGCLFRSNNGLSNAASLLVFMTASGGVATVQNNIFYDVGSSSDGAIPIELLDNANIGITWNVFNNTIQYLFDIGPNHPTLLYWREYPGTINIQNNAFYAVSGNQCFVFEPGYGSPTVTAWNANATTDSTATLFSGTGNQTNISTSEAFASSHDVHPQVKSNLIAAGANLSGTNNNDASGTPWVVPYNIGALMVVPPTLPYQSRVVTVTGFLSAYTGANGTYVQRGTGNQSNNPTNKKVPYFVQPNGLYHLYGFNSGTGTLWIIDLISNGVSGGLSDIAYSVTISSDPNDPGTTSNTWSVSGSGTGSPIVTSVMVTDPVPKYSWVDMGLTNAYEGFVNDVYVGANADLSVLLLGFTVWGANTSSPAPIIQSSNKGLTWAFSGNYPANVTALPSSSKLGKILVSSDDGTKLFSNSFGGGSITADLQVSTVSGSSWTDVESGTGIDANYSVGSSADGSVLIVYKYQGVYKSTSHGSSWVQLLSGNYTWGSVDGTFLIRAGNRVYQSFDNCATFTPFATLTSIYDNWGWFWDTANVLVAVDHINTGSGGGGTNIVHISTDKSNSFSQEYAFPSSVIVGDSYIISADKKQIIIPYRTTLGVGVVLGTLLPPQSSLFFLLA